MRSRGNQNRAAIAVAMLLAGAAGATEESHHLLATPATFYTDTDLKTASSPAYLQLSIEYWKGRYVHDHTASALTGYRFGLPFNDDPPVGAFMPAQGTRAAALPRVSFGTVSWINWNYSNWRDMAGRSSEYPSIVPGLWANLKGWLVGAGGIATPPPAAGGPVRTELAAMVSVGREIRF